MSISLSYVLTTYNKLEYLKITLPKLIEACKADEEIVIIDGGSSDGTIDFLTDLHRAGKIHKYISEKDYGESHGTNKGMLMAEGELIKIITDDDAYGFRAIQECKLFMLQHPEIDVLGFDGYGYLISTDKPVFVKKNVLADFNIWKNSKTPFIFCGLSLLMRRKSLALLGLFNTTVRMIDFEYTIRISSSKCKIAWYTGLAYVNIANESSNSTRFWKLSMVEKEKLEYFYLDKLPFLLFRTKDKIKNIFRPLKRALFGKIISSNQVEFPAAYNNALTRLESDFCEGTKDVVF